MYQNNEFSCFNIREFIQPNKEGVIGEELLNAVLSDFRYPQNIDVEAFLKKNAVEFTRKNQSVTYLVLSNEKAELLGYFTLTIKPITVAADKFSNTTRRKLLRVGEFDEERNIITLPAYLIAQLGKNYNEDAAGAITGEILLKTAMKVIKKLQYSIGGMVVFLEAEDNEKLKTFYIRENGYKEFKTREVCGGGGKQH